MTLLIAAALALQPAPLPSEIHNFENWAVTCDNTLRCQAVSLHPEGQFDENGRTLFVERGPEPDAPLRVSLVEIDAAPASIHIYNEALPVRFSDDQGDVAITLSDQAAFLERAAYADRLELKNAAGAVTGQVALGGLGEALLYMDERQGRLHTPTALMRTGRRPASAIPPAPQVPQIALAPAATGPALTFLPARIAQLRRERRCAIADVGGPDEVVTAALGEGRTLVLLSCGSGAYNVSMVPFVATGSGRDIRIEPAPFDEPLDVHDEAAGQRALINADWDAQTRTINDFSKGRGLGDCGSRSRYGWDGTRFRLLEREEMRECRGTIRFLTTWRTQVTR